MGTFWTGLLGNQFLRNNFRLPVGASNTTSQRAPCRNFDSLSPTEWRNFPNQKEINYRGHMFDVEHVVEEETGVTLWGHYDTKEDGLRQLEKNHTITIAYYLVVFLFFCGRLPPFFLYLPACS
jgi:hypothetical protein